METVKTKMIDDKNRATPRYRGLVHGVTTIVKEDGIAGVYAGVVPTMLKQGANQAVRFAIYGRIKALICGDSGQITTLQSMLTGSLAGFVSVYATMPFDVGLTCLGRGRTRLISRRFRLSRRACRAWRQRTTRAR